MSARPGGVTSGMLNLSRNLGLITGASVIGAVFSLAAHTSDLTTASPGSVATSMRITFSRRSPDRRGARRATARRFAPRWSRDHHRRHATRRAHRLGQLGELVRAEPYVEVKDVAGPSGAERAVGAAQADGRQGRANPSNPSRRRAGRVGSRPSMALRASDRDRLAIQAWILTLRNGWLDTKPIRRAQGHRGRDPTRPLGRLLGFDGFARPCRPSA